VISESSLEWLVFKVSAKGSSSQLRGGSGALDLDFQVLGIASEAAFFLHRGK
jgi:hypothetical protein